MTSPRFFSPAKINLYLWIIGRRADGFHELETLMLPLAMGDSITCTPEDGSAIRISCNKPGVPTDETNLVHKAVCILRREFPELEKRGLHIDIEKTTPMGGGMGGGSSNGATVLKALNEMWGLGLSTEKLEVLCARLGSDCAFFIRNTAALCRGRGEIIEPVEIATKLDLVIINPGFGISTKWSYESLPQYGYPKAPPVQNLIACLNHGRLDSLQGHLYNTLERPAFDKHLILPVMRQHLVEAGCVAAMMSGSGSTLFGVAPSGAAAQNAASALRARYGEELLVITTQTL
ncbi:MAG: 4-(cytidine 5'-diphospho)-2-C-methyl-D-erythritol kinase [Verrucomicrobiae bacterium]|nr:4-(cytidine 5'-diphospho)-2-C-methyl-D-erythritol kinase [Verrucomicrobiae bacterium]